MLQHPLSPSLTYILAAAAGCRPVPPYSHYTPNPITSAFSICCRRLSPWKLLRHHGSRDGGIPLGWKYAKVRKSLKMCVGPKFYPMWSQCWRAARWNWKSKSSTASMWKLYKVFATQVSVEVNHRTDSIQSCMSNCNEHMRSSMNLGPGNPTMKSQNEKKRNSTRTRRHAIYG